MKFYLIRHGIAEKNDTKSDLERVLTWKGREKIRKTYKKMKAKIKSPDLILCSKALRSIETAELLSIIWKINKIERHEQLNPNSSIEDYVSVLNQYIKQKDLILSNLRIAIVTHEPDLSNFASYLIQHSLRFNLTEKIIEICKPTHFIDFRIKKGAIMILDWDGHKGKLEFYVTPKMIMKS